MNPSCAPPVVVDAEEALVDGIAPLGAEVEASRLSTPPTLLLFAAAADWAAPLDDTADRVWLRVVAKLGCTLVAGDVGGLPGDVVAPDTADAT